MNYEYPPVGGGGGKVCQQISEGLAERGHDITVLTARQGNLATQEKSDNLKVYRIPAFRRHRDRSGPLAMAVYIASATVFGYRLTRSLKPAVIHAHFAVPTGAAAWAISRVLGIPYVLTAHLGDVPGGVPEQTDKLFRWVYPFTVPIWRDAADTTAVSSFVAELVMVSYQRRPHLILNGINLSQIPEPIIDQRTGPPRLIWAGRMQTQKNLLFGLRALARVRDLSWWLALVGDGPQRAELEALTLELGLSERVVFHGWLSNEAVQHLMAESDILFMPSLSEGLSMVAIEALAHGLAMLCSRIRGFADVAYDRVNARVCSLDDPEAFANALRDMCVNRWVLKKMQKASRRIVNKFDLRGILDAYEETLQAAAAAAQTELP